MEIGDKYNRLTVIKFLYKRGSYSYYLFKCNCGKEHITREYYVKNNLTKSCGCWNRERAASINFENITGQRFNRLEVICLSKKRNKENQILWECLCDCGNTTSVITNRLKSGLTKSCGCYRKEKIRERDYTGNELFSGEWYHGFRNNANTRDIKWDISKNDIIQINKKQNGLCYYTGDKLSFPTTLKEYRLGNYASLDRIDSKDHYYKNNCCLCTKIANLCKWQLPIEVFEFYCKQIYKHQNKLYISQDRTVEILKYNNSFKGYKNIGLSTYNRIKSDANKRGVYFNISIEDIWNIYEKQKYICSLSGLDIDFSAIYKSTKYLQTASIDRIDSSKGYTIDNIQILNKHINYMKLYNSDNNLIELCTKVVKYRKLL